MLQCVSPALLLRLVSCTHGFPSSEFLAVIDAESRGPWRHSSKEQIYSFSTLEQTCSLVVTTMSNKSRKLTKSCLMTPESPSSVGDNLKGPTTAESRCHIALVVKGHGLCT